MKYLLDGEETKRLKFRLLEPDDFNDWLTLFDGTNVARLLGMGNIPTAKAQCQNWFNIQENRYQNNIGGMNVLVDKTSGEMVGQCGLLIQEVDNIQELEIGYAILPGYWNEGFATEAALKCRDFAFEQSFTNSIISIIHIENKISEKVALNNGMKKTKRTVYKNMPVNIFRITNEEWVKMKK